MEPQLFVFSVGNDLCAPVGVCSVRTDQGVHGAPLLENLIGDHVSAVEVISKAEKAMKGLGATRIFSVSHPDNLPERDLFEGRQAQPQE